MRSWLTLGLVAAGCYSPHATTRCSVTCDPFDNRCPDQLTCGTDSFCHGPTEALNFCTLDAATQKPPTDASVPDSTTSVTDAPVDATAD